MSRRADPERIYHAQREGNKQRLMAGGLGPETAEAWIAAWEREAADDSVIARGSGVWDAGWEWIGAERQFRRNP
jgi:hypothetical protein